MIVTLSSVALPGTNGFVGEFLILLGSWKANPGLTALATTGVIFGAVYMLWMFQRVMFGPLTNRANQSLSDLGAREIAYLAPLVVLVFAMGVFPQVFLDRINPSVDRFVQRIEARFDQTPYVETGFVPGWLTAAAAEPAAHGEEAPAHNAEHGE